MNKKIKAVVFKSLVQIPINSIVVPKQSVDVTMNFDRSIVVGTATLKKVKQNIEAEFEITDENLQGLLVYPSLCIRLGGNGTTNHNEVVEVTLTINHNLDNRIKAIQI